MFIQTPLTQADWWKHEWSSCWGMSKWPVGEYPRAGWQAAPSTWLWAPGGSPAACTGGSSPSRGKLHMQRGGSVQGQRWSRLQPQAWSPSVLEQQLLLGLQPSRTCWVSVSARLEAQERWSWCNPLQSQVVSPARKNFGHPGEQAAVRVSPALSSQVGIICCIGEGAWCSQVTGRQIQGYHLGECRSV